MLKTTIEIRCDGQRFGNTHCKEMLHHGPRNCTSEDTAREVAKANGWLVVGVKYVFCWQCATSILSELERMVGGKGE